MFNYVFAIRNKTSSPHLNIIFYIQVLNGLAYLHSISISHGALNPNHVILHQNKWKLTHFGLTEIGCHSKDILFNAPEVIKGEVKSNASADMFSLGILCFWIHDDRVPFSVKELIGGLNEGSGLEKRIHWDCHQQVGLKYNGWV